MDTRTNTSCSLHRVAALIVCIIVFGINTARSQITSGVDRNTSQKTGSQNECAVAKNPTNVLQLFTACNNSGPGLYAARSTDGGLTWIYPDPADKTIADGDANQGPTACCDPTLAWDEFGNLFLGYLDAGPNNIIVLLSTDGGATFTTLATFGPASVDQPTVAVGAGQVWVVWNQSGSMVARGASVTGLGTIGAFNALQNIPGTASCSFGDIAISPMGAVCQVCQTLTNEGPGTIRANIDADGLGPGNFGASISATTTNVGAFDKIPAQNNRTIDAEAGLTYDRNPESDHVGRLYMVYTEEVTDEGNNTDIMLRFSDNDGANWSVAQRVNDDPAAPVRSQFLPRIASNPISGNIGITWFDCRNSAANNTIQIFATLATPTGASPTFLANQPISDGTSNGNGGGSMQYGDYNGMAYFQGIIHPAWPDNSNSTSNNPDLLATYDVYTDRVFGGSMASEGDPHITSIGGIYYDFQSAGEFVALRGDGLEIQTRQTAIATSFTIANNYTGLNTCVSLNTAVAARVGTRRVTYQPSLNGVPDPAGMQLRIDGQLTTLGANGIDLGQGGRIVKSSTGNGIEIDFPNGSTLIVTPGWWTSQSKWYLNVNVYHTTATEGLMGVLAPGSWLPALPDGSSLGPKPASTHDRYIALNEKFADAWRVKDAKSLFDYAPGTSTASFTIQSWPKENPPCDIPNTIPAKPLKIDVARQLCAGVTGKSRNASCVFDVMVTGDPGFAKTYLLTQRVEVGATNTVLTGVADTIKYGQQVTFIAIVMRKTFRTREPLPGYVQFTVDGKKIEAQVKLNANGRAMYRTRDLAFGNHSISATYVPAKGSKYLPSKSVDKTYAVLGK